MGLVTIAEQRGKVFAVASHNMPAKDLKRHIQEMTKTLTELADVSIRTVSIEEFRAMPFGPPTEKKAFNVDQLSMPL